MVRGSLSQTRASIVKLAKSLPANAVVCFFGDLGAGKTTLIKAMIHELIGLSEDAITSPTFNYCQSYGNVHHFDLYRLKSADEFCALGFDEYFDQGICLIEWSERIVPIIPKDAILVHIEIVKPEIRTLKYEKNPLQQGHISNICS